MPSSYDTAGEIAQEATMWHSIGGVSLFQEEMQMKDREATCTCYCLVMGRGTLLCWHYLGSTQKEYIRYHQKKTLIWKKRHIHKVCTAPNLSLPINLCSGRLPASANRATNSNSSILRESKLIKQLFKLWKNMNCGQVRSNLLTYCQQGTSSNLARE